MRQRAAVELTDLRAIRVVIVGGLRLFGEALRVLLSREDGVHIVGHTAQWGRTKELLDRFQPDVVLVDGGPSELDPEQVIRVIRHERPGTKIIVLTISRDVPTICRALKAGASGYVSKDASPSDLTRAIRGVHEGEVWVERRLIGELIARFAGGTLLDPPRQPARRDQPHPPAAEALTRREREILAQLAFGGTNRHIAAALCISEKTVKTHLNSIFRKLNVTRRLQAVIYAVAPHGVSTEARSARTGPPARPRAFDGDC